MRYRQFRATDRNRLISVVLSVRGIVQGYAIDDAALERVLRLEVGDELEWGDHHFRRLADVGEPNRYAEGECPHAAPFRYCPTCVVSPCPIGLPAQFNSTKEAP